MRSTKRKHINGAVGTTTVHHSEETTIEKNILSLEV